VKSGVFCASQQSARFLEIEMERETKELKTKREEIAAQTAEYLKAGGKIQHAGNEQTDYAKSGMHQYNNQKRCDRARMEDGK
jgi:hypothetical protein